MNTRLSRHLSDWRRNWIGAGLIEFALDGAIMVRSVDLGAFPQDRADRFIAATALALKATLVTADERILSWQHPVLRQDARI